jgi:hypothetical protein
MIWKTLSSEAVPCPVSSHKNVLFFHPLSCLTPDRPKKFRDIFAVCCLIVVVVIVVVLVDGVAPNYTVPFFFCSHTPFRFVHCRGGKTSLEPSYPKQRIALSTLLIHGLLLLGGPCTNVAVQATPAQAHAALAQGLQTEAI